MCVYWLLLAVVTVGFGKVAFLIIVDRTGQATIAYFLYIRMYSVFLYIHGVMCIFRNDVHHVFSTFLYMHGGVLGV